MSRIVIVIFYFDSLVLTCVRMSQAHKSTEKSIEMDEFVQLLIIILKTVTEIIEIVCFILRFQLPEQLVVQKH
jgi:hypothetical protein